MINGNEPAYPSFCGRNDGISIRLDLIKAALTGLCANPDLSHHLSESIAVYAIDIADSVISILNDTEPEEKP